MEIRVVFRELEPEDLPDLEWSGGPVHLRELARIWSLTPTAQVELLVGQLDNGRLVALGGVDFRPDPDAGRLWLLAVPERLRSLGIGSALIAELEGRIRVRGRSRAGLTVELDNPWAEALYERLGYRTVRPVVERWPDESGGIHVAECLLMERDLHD